MSHRINCEPEELKSMVAHIAYCKYCNGPVKMFRDLITLRLRPDHCSCLKCGQRYYMIIADINQWELEQWQQKASD